MQHLIKDNVGERINCRASANPKPNSEFQFVFSCHLFIFNFFIKVIWRKDSELLSYNPRYFINSSGIAIKDKVTDKDGGVFRISALVTETGATHEKQITVQIYCK